MNRPALSFEKVTRTFGRKVAIESLDLRIEPGTVLGLIGRNGAGKTTSLRLAHGILYPDSGNIEVLGMNPVTDGLEVRRRVSLLQEETGLYPWMTVEEILRFGGSLHPDWDNDMASSLSRKLDLDPKAEIKTLSRGTRAKVSLVLAVSSRPELLLLDDPTAGLDPLVRREVLEGLLEGLHDQGGAVVYASHLVHDIERVSDRVAVLDEGRAVLEGSLEEIKERVVKLEAVFDDDVPDTIDLPGMIDRRADGRTLTVVANGHAGDAGAKLKTMGAGNVTLEQLPLEEILVAYLRSGRKENGDV